MILSSHPCRIVFQLTPSRRATFPFFRVALPELVISTHALTEGDPIDSTAASIRWHFNSRPHGGRQNVCFGVFSHTHFNSRPHGGRLPFFAVFSKFLIFQLTPSRRATAFSPQMHSPSVFQLTPSRRATAVSPSST